MDNYVQLNNILDSKVGVVTATICFIALIFAAGFFLGRIKRIKKLEDKWDKELAKLQEATNEILGKAGISKKVTFKRGGGQ